MPRYTSYPVYSSGQYPQQLYQYPQHPSASAYGWGYPQYPHYAPMSAMPHPSYSAYPVSPRQGRKEYRRSVSPSPEIELDELLGGRYRPTAVWDVSQDVPAARLINRGALDKIPEPFLNRPATTPAVNRMRIVSDEFPWDINIAFPRNEIVTVGNVFVAIYGTLQNHLDVETWDDETPNGKRNLHRARCMRLARGVAAFKVDSHIKKVDLLGDKTFFMGLKPHGPPDQPGEWLLKLGPPPKQGRR